ncbi:MAG: dTMP kinase [Myxococcota bacterium]
MTRGSLIVLEGLDGTGKSTQLPRLARRLEARGHRVRLTAEPYDCPPGRRIREIARSGTPAAPAEELALFMEQRRLHVRELIEPVLARGEVVLSDRYFLSTVAYQGARGLDAEALLAANESEFPLPDLALLLVLDAADGLTRAAGRAGHAEPVFEHREFLERVAAIFAGLDRPYLERVDAAGSPETVEERIAGVVSRRLGLL